MALSSPKSWPSLTYGAIEAADRQPPRRWTASDRLPFAMASVAALARSEWALIRPIDAFTPAALAARFTARLTPASEIRFAVTTSALVMDLNKNPSSTAAASRYALIVAAQPA